jgi:hypothetical protein
LNQSTAATCPLDIQLSSLSLKETLGNEMPLALKRFMNEFGVNRPTVAMRIAADTLLVAYGESVGYLKPPLSVERLCVLCSAELAGSRPSSARRHNAYSAAEYKPRAGHTGKLFIRNSQIIIKIPDEIEFETARLSVAHEIGHLLIHRRGGTCDEATIRLSTSTEEEALAEYAARLLLLPGNTFCPRAEENLAEYAVAQAGIAKAPVHSAVSRLGDPDVPSLGVRGAILWRINPELPKSGPLYTRLTPQWHLCPGAFVPVRRCKARVGSLIAELADLPSAKAGSDIQSVNIGTFVGTFRVDVFAWGSVPDGTRSVLSVFRSAE